MILVSSVLLYFLFHFTESEKCVIDNRPRSTAWEDELRKYLFSCYKKHEAPDANDTQVALKFMLKSFYFDNKEEIFTMNTWLFISWNDPRLSWNSDNYDGIIEVLLSSINIWTPSLKLHSSVGFDDLDFYMTLCKVSSSGHVSCIPNLSHQTFCGSKLKDWPYDTQNCTFKFGFHSKFDPVTLTFNTENAVSMLGAEYGSGWNIIDFKSGEDSKSAVKFYLNFIVERQGVGLAAVVIVPSLVLSVLTLVPIVLNADDKIRLGLLCFSLLNQFMFMQEISNDIPKHSRDTPTVLIYLRTSIVLTLFGIGLTFLLNYIRKMKTLPPNCIVTLNEKLLEPYGKYLIWLRLKTDEFHNNNEEVANKITSVWTDFASIINFISVVTFAIVYFVSFLSYIPKQIQIINVE